MYRKLKILLAAALAVILFISLLLEYKHRPPDFSAIKNVDARKKAFVAYLKPVIEDINLQRAAERQELEGIYSDLLAGKEPDYWKRHQLKVWAKRYAIEYREDNLKAIAERLRLHLDQIPSSMVLAQAALESAWGTSRFAAQGNNFFGQWCFTKGCGMVPKARPEDAKHEVKEFNSTEDSLYRYFNNINSNPVYQQVREIRTQAREAGKPLSGLDMVAGLENYSQRGQAYIDDLRSVIRSNNFR